jgi:hypothetical protein
MFSKLSAKNSNLKTNRLLGPTRLNLLDEDSNSLLINNIDKLDELIPMVPILDIADQETKFSRKPKLLSFHKNIPKFKRIIEDDGSTSKVVAQDKTCASSTLDIS